MTFQYCYTPHPSTSSTQHIHTFQLHYNPVFRQITYLHTFYSPLIFRFLPHISGIPHFFIFPLSPLTLCVKIFSFPTHSRIFTHALVRLFTMVLTQLSTTKLTHVSRYRTFLVNGLYYINKTSHHHINKTTFAQIFQF